MMGMARKNVNSAAAVREQPDSMPPMMVAQTVAIITRGPRDRPPMSMLAPPTTTA